MDECEAYVSRLLDQAELNECAPPPTDLARALPLAGVVRTAHQASSSRSLARSPARVSHAAAEAILPMYMKASADYGLTSKQRLDGSTMGMWQRRYPTL